MKIPRYWTHHAGDIEVDGHVRRLKIFGWSDEGLAQAEAKARERFARTADAMRRGDEPRNDYDYADRPLREERLKVWEKEGAERAILTRNGYGALVLNTASVVFVDVDFERRGGPAGCAALFAPKPATDPRTDEALERIRAWQAQHPDDGVRVYRTLAGLRCVLTSRVLSPDAEEAWRIMAELGADPLYVRLCEVQRCYRARVSAKPWRVGAQRPPSRWPFEDPETESRFLNWLEGYDLARQGFTVCHLLDDLTPRTGKPMDDEVRWVLALHDEMSLGAESVPLA